MLKYSESKYKHVESDKETMRSDLASFVLSHSDEDDSLIYKRTTYCLNVKREHYAFDEDVLVSYSEFFVETEYHYDSMKVTWWDGSTLVKKYYTEKRGT